MTNRPITGSAGALWSKAIAGLALGTGLGLAVSGILLVSSGGLGAGTPGFEIRNQVAMWSVPATAILVWSGAFLFRTAFRAWAALGLANVLAWAALAWIR